MIHPSLQAILETMSQVFEKTLLPGLEASLRAEKSENQEKMNLSAALTLSHFVRYIEIRGKSEKELLQKEVRLLKPLLDRLRSFLSRHDPVESAALVGRIDAVLENQSQMPADELLGIHVGHLRCIVQDGVKRMVQLRSRAGDMQDYQDLRAELRSYMGRQLLDESTVIDAAFAGRGYRR